MTGIVCPTCQGAQEVECYRRESDTGHALTSLCPQCEGEGVVEPETFPCDCCGEEDCNCGVDFCVDCDHCPAHCICVEGKYEEADRQLSENYELEGE